MIKMTDHQNCKPLFLHMQLTTFTDNSARLFMHGGHTNHMADFSWNSNEPWLVASAAEDNLLQIWKVADSIVGKDDGDLPVDELER